MKKPFAATLITIWMVPLLSLSAPSSFAQPTKNEGEMRRGEMRRGGMRPDGMRRGRAKMQLDRTWRGVGRLDESDSPLSKAQSQKIVSLILPWSKRPQMSEIEAQMLHSRLETLLTTPQKNQLQNARFGGPRNGGPRRERRNGERRNGGPRGEGNEGEHFGARPRGERAPEGFGGPREGRGEGRRDGREGGRGGREGGRREMRGMSATQIQTVRAWMETVNPFYAPTGTASWKTLPANFQTRIARRYQQGRTTLETLSRKAKS